MTIGDLDLEAYPNRDSMPYQELYGLDDARTMFRGTLRYPGWSVMMRNLVKIGFLADDVHEGGKLKPIDQLGSLMVDLMAYREGEKDMVVQHHEFEIEVDGRHELRTSTLFDYGVPHGDSSMSRTVSLPAAMAAKLMVQGGITAKGVKIPIEPEIYEPIMTALETLGIRFKEETKSL